MVKNGLDGRRLGTLKLVLAALVLRSLIPDGYMLGDRAELAAGTMVVPCPAQDYGALAALLKGATHHHHHGDDAGGAADGEDSCPFALAAAPALGSESPLAPWQCLPPEVPVVDDVTSPAFSAFFIAEPARGPPRFS